MKNPLGFSVLQPQSGCKMKNIVGAFRHLGIPLGIPISAAFGKYKMIFDTEVEVNENTDSATINQLLVYFKEILITSESLLKLHCAGYLGNILNCLFLVKYD